MTVQGPAFARPRLRILVVEDEPTARSAMQRLLELRGHAVTAVASPGEAVDAAGSLRPQVLISDWKLGDAADGLELAVQLLEHHSLAVIMITAHRLERMQHKARAMQLELAACRRKPVSVTELAELAESLVLG